MRPHTIDRVLGGPQFADLLARCYLGESPPITGAAKGPLPRTRHVYEVSTFHRVSPGSCGRKVAPLLPSSHPSTHWAPIQTPRSGRRGRPHRAQRRRDSPRHTTERTTSQAGRSHLSPPRASGPGGCECFQTESMPPPAAGRSSRSAWSSSSTQPSKAEPTAAPVAPAYLIREARTHHLERRRGHPGCFGTQLESSTPRRLRGGAPGRTSPGGMSGHGSACRHGRGAEAREARGERPWGLGRSAGVRPGIPLMRI